MSQPNSFSLPSAQDLPSVDALRAVYADKHVGELFEFGRYPQGDDGDMKPITWRVLLREADYLLVIAEQCLDCKPYEKEHRVTWANCTLRHWLNSEFYDKAFNEQERECILKTSVVNNAGPETEDRVFLLSVDELESLIANDIERCARPTDYAVKNDVYFDDDNGCCFWWLRSCGANGSRAAFVLADGRIDIFGYHVLSGINAVRPALKLAL